MQIYLVGGAVRDTLLNYPVHEKDWVVVGETPESMLKAGFRLVGKDFPVFLHPKTNDEYALARTERKSAPGYKGFIVHASPDISLEQDLIRRDLTINAMAMDPEGQLIDPYGGQQDLENRKTSSKCKIIFYLFQHLEHPDYHAEILSTLFIKILNSN